MPRSWTVREIFAAEQRLERSVFRTYKLVWSFLTARERRNFLLLILLTIVMSVFEIIGVAGILPLLSVLGDPDLLRTNHWLAMFVQILGIETDRQAMLILGIVVLLVIVSGMVVRAGVTYLQFRFALMRAHSIGSRVLAGYLRQEYVWFLSRHSSDLSQSLLSEIDTVIRESILPAVLLVSNVMLILLIGGLLFVVEPWVAVGAVSMLLGVYVLIYLLLRQRMGQVGSQRLEANSSRFHIVQEIGGGLEEVKIMGLEASSLARFRVAARKMAHFQTLGQVMSRLPRFALEATVYAAFIIMVLVLILLRGRNMADLVPLFALIGMAGTKLFPALQQVYQQLGVMRTSEPALEKLHASVMLLDKLPPRAEDGAQIHLRDQIELDAVHFRYPDTERDTLDGFTATIPARTTLGIVGGTGAGKTTLVDIVLGLLTPDAGALRIDGVEITADRVRGWQRSLGYVPQQIFLSDSTVAANIAFGTPPDAIDMAAVERAAKVANLHDFVMSELPRGYLTEVGERGVRLSGGQRQRIGIARALYHDPDVLILDEATSALDNITERAVMEAMHNLAGAKTVIMIAHRLSTVQSCDSIFLLEHGRLAAHGTYDELVAQNESFRRMAVG